MTIRVHELARELKITSKQILTALAELKQPVKTASSILTYSQAHQVRLKFPQPPTFPRRPSPTFPATATRSPRPPRVGTNPFGVIPRRPRPQPAPTHRAAPALPPDLQQMYANLAGDVSVSAHHGSPRPTWMDAGPRVDIFDPLIMSLLPADRTPTQEDLSAADTIKWVWQTHGLSSEQAIAWINMGLSPDESDLAGQLRDEGITPEAASQHRTHPNGTPFTIIDLARAKDWDEPIWKTLDAAGIERTPIRRTS